MLSIRKLPVFGLLALTMVPELSLPQTPDTIRLDARVGIAISFLIGIAILIWIVKGSVRRRRARSTE